MLTFAASLQGQTLATKAFDSIVDFIMAGELQPGAILNEVEIAKRLSMSRGPVREAVRRLEGRKLVNREPHQRARVVALGPREVREIFELREGLEGVACRLATRAMDDAGLAKMSAALESARGSGSADFDLHWEIAQGCGNTRIRELLCDQLYYLLRLYRKRSGAAPQRGPEAYEEHWQIVRAMRTHDADLAESLMRSHIRRATEHLTALL